MNTHTVVTAHTPPDQIPLNLKTGDVIAVTDKPTEWPGWLWGTDAERISGWVPASYLHRTGDSGRMLRDYNSTELTVAPGERVSVLDEESSWLRCETADGKQGWIPATAVKLSPERGRS